jgi:hypothetical protein
LGEKRINYGIYINWITVASIGWRNIMIEVKKTFDNAVVLYLVEDNKRVLLTFEEAAKLIHDIVKTWNGCDYRGPK